MVRLQGEILVAISLPFLVRDGDYECTFLPFLSALVGFFQEAPRISDPSLVAKASQRQFLSLYATTFSPRPPFIEGCIFLSD